MRKGNLTSEEVADQFGIEIIKRLDHISCEPTNRVGYCGACAGNSETEYAASIKLPTGATLTAYYYTTNAQEADMAEADDTGAIDWDEALNGYEIR